jgi:ABC-type polar amino acid transport system, ATPase component
MDIRTTAAADDQNLSPAAPLVVAADVRKRFGDNEVLRGIDIAVPKGEVLCIIGPSGSGKSTFLRCINQLERIDGGAIWVAGELVGYRREGNFLHELTDAEIARQRRRIGMVFQRFNLFPHLTAVENIIEGPVQVLGEKPAEARERAEALLARVGLSDKRDAYPAHLSGGQQQRVAIARALAMRPELLLFDEPTSALDPELVGEVLGVMRDLAGSGMTMIVVTHELGFAREVGNRVAFMDQGQLVEIGDARQVLTEPQQARTRAFISAVHK